MAPAGVHEDWACGWVSWAGPQCPFFFMKDVVWTEMAVQLYPLVRMLVSASNGLSWANYWQMCTAVKSRVTQGEAFRGTS